jgi:multidrug efflux pump subunit AcrB
LYLTLTSETLPLYTVDEYAETLLAQRISMASGVSRVLVYGAQKYAVRVQLSPEALVARGIGIDEVLQAVRQNNTNLPTGKLYGDSAMLSTALKPTRSPPGSTASAASFWPFSASPELIRSKSSITSSA